MSQSIGARPSQTPDRVMAITLLLALAAALGIGAEYDQLRLAVFAGGTIAAIGIGTWLLAPGTLATRLVFAATLASMVALHIQLGRGTIEFHFGVFVLLGLLLVYVDWRPIAFAAGLFAVHHIAFDRLQAAGFGVYCTPSPSFLKVVMHAAYLIMQTVAEVCMAIMMQRIASQEARAAGMLNDTLSRLKNAMATTRESVAGIETASSEIAGGNTDLSQRTEKTAGELQRAASSMEQLTATVRHSAESAVNATQLATGTAAVAERGGEVVREVVSKMVDITASSRRIADIIGVIDGIAFQTNILALNAAVEAARAGEQGRGFAVVASEVRSLAHRSADAAREIKGLIHTSVENVESGSRLVEQAGSTMQEIVDGVRRVAGIIDEISRAAVEQSAGLEQVNSTVIEIDQMTQQNAALVEQGAAAAESLRVQAGRLAGVVSSF